MSVPPFFLLQLPAVDTDEIDGRERSLLDNPSYLWS
jgi:hypothetical protein